MKNLLLYFYLLCFIVLSVLGVLYFTVEDDFIFFAVLLQLIWGPISALHCLYMMADTWEESTSTSLMYKISFALTVVYFVVVSFLSTAGPSSIGIHGDLAFFIGIGLIPWLMFAFFTYIVYQDRELNV